VMTVEGSNDEKEEEHLREGFVVTKRGKERERGGATTNQERTQVLVHLQHRSGTRRQQPTKQTA